MSPDDNALAVSSDATCLEIVKAMLTHDVGELRVVDRSGGLLGIVRSADLLAPDVCQPAPRFHLSALADQLLGRDADWLFRSGGRLAADVMIRCADLDAPTGSTSTSTHLIEAW